MKSMFQMMKDIFSMPFPWNVWVMVLALVNLSGGIYYLASLEGKVAIGAMIGAALCMQYIYVKYGFVRLLGLGHIIFWLPQIALYIWTLSTSPMQSMAAGFAAWLVTIIVLNGFSLILDLRDVVLYYLGDRRPMKVLQPH